MACCRSVTAALTMAFWLAGTCLALPTVRVTLTDRSILSGTLLGFEDGILTVRSGDRVHRLRPAQVREVRFVAGKGSPEGKPGNAAAGRSSAAVEEELDRLEKRFLWTQPRQLVAFTQEQVRSGDSALLRKLMERLEVDARSRGNRSIAGLRRYLAHTCLRAFLQPVGELIALRREVEAWGRRPALRNRHGELKNEILRAIDGRLGSGKSPESGRSKQPGKKGGE